MLFDNHYGKSDHLHIDGEERPYELTSVSQLRKDFEAQVRKLGGAL